VAGVILLISVPGIILLDTKQVAQRRVELTFVGYGYDTITLRITNPTSSRLLVQSAGPLNTEPVIVIVKEYSTEELRTTPRKLRSESIPAQILVDCLPLPPASKLRRYRAALLKKVGIDTVGTNFTLSVDLPALDSVSLPPKL